MFRPWHWIAAATVCISAAGCAPSDSERVNREILLSTVWCGQQFVPRTQGPLPEEATERRLYIFGENGILSVLAEEAGPGSEAVEELRYIYTPQAAEMVIDTYGSFVVREISVERLWLEGIYGTLDLHFYADTETVPQKKSVQGAGLFAAPDSAPVRTTD
jgi:hypothetical protein